MILTPHEARSIAAGRKTMIRIPVVGDARHSPYPVGSSHPVQPGFGQPSDAQIAVLETRREQAGDITTADAKLEGNLNVDWWKQAWVRKHDHHWMRRELVDRADIYGDQVVPFILLARFEQEWANRDVWVVRFWLDEVRPRYLARPTRTSGDYVMNASRSIDTEHHLVTGRDGTTHLTSVAVPVANPEYVAAKAKEDHSLWVAQRDSFRRDLETERQRRRNERIPNLRDAA